MRRVRLKHGYMVTNEVNEDPHVGGHWVLILKSDGEENGGYQDTGYKEVYRILTVLDSENTEMLTAHRFYPNAFEEAQ